MNESGKWRPDPMKGRYQVFEGSYSAHCCFDASILDTAELTHEHKENRYYKNVLEVFDFDDAERIAEAMNKN